MPGSHHLKGNVSEKRQRQYEHIRASESAAGKSMKEAKKLAAMTVNKQRREAGETKKQ
jgi:hypothetical protein